jgi:hypothetical protein
VQFENFVKYKACRKMMGFLVRVKGLARLRAALWSALTALGSHSLPTLQVRYHFKKLKNADHP